MERERSAFSTGSPDPEKTDRVIACQKQIVRIFYLGKFFDYPIKLNWKTVSNLGMIRIAKIGWSYLRVKIFPVKQIKSLKIFSSTGLGKNFMRRSLKIILKKVWAFHAMKLPPTGARRELKNCLYPGRCFMHSKHFIRKIKSIEQKNTDTSLIGRFMYPKLGPRQMWETVAKIIEERGGVIIKNAEVTGLKTAGKPGY
jgi:protoporphyrinogen oxidase